MDFSNFYNDELYSDILLVLRTNLKVVETVAVPGSSSSSSKRNHTDVTTDASTIYHDDITIPAHAMVLVTASPYFKARLSTAWQSTLHQPDNDHSMSQEDRATKTYYSCDSKRAKRAVLSEDERSTEDGGSSLVHTQQSQKASPDTPEALEVLLEALPAIPAPTSNTDNKRVLIEYVEEGEISAIKVVIKSMYKGKLDKEVRNKSAELLLQCYVVASRFSVQHCIEDCARALNSLPDSFFTKRVLRKFYGSPQLLSEECSPHFVTLRKKVEAALLAMFGDVPAILSKYQSTTSTQGPAPAASRITTGGTTSRIRCTTLFQQFLLLPYHAVLQWLQSDELVVHSENCVVELLSLWMMHEDNGKRCSIAESTELLKNIRVLQLSPSYLIYISDIAWTQPIFNQSPALRSALQKVQLRRLSPLKNIKKKVPSHLLADYQLDSTCWSEAAEADDSRIIPRAWTLRRRCRPLPAAGKLGGWRAVEASFGWRMDAEAMDRQYEEGFTSFDRMPSSPELLYCSGYWLYVGLGVLVENARFSLCAYLLPAIDAVLVGAKETVVSADFSINGPNNDVSLKAGSEGNSTQVMSADTVLHKDPKFHDYIFVCKDLTALSIRELVEPIVVDGKLVMETQVWNVL